MTFKVHYLVEIWKTKIYFLCTIFLSRIINRNNPFQQKFKRILVIKVDEIGDMITALPALQILRNNHPKAEIVLFCKPLVKNIVQSDSSISKVVSDKNELSGKFDLIIDLRGTWSMFRYTLLHLPKCYLNRGTVRFKNKKSGQQKHEVEANVQIMESVLQEIPKSLKLRLEIKNEDHCFAKEWIENQGLKNFVLLHAGARRPLKQWSPDRFTELSRYFNDKKFQLVFCGGPEDIDVNNEIIGRLNFTAINMAGKTSLMQFAAIASHAKLFVGNDSGPMHLASAVNIPALGLFGPSVTETFRPYHDKGAFIHHKLPCNPCDQIHCVQPHDVCINRITLKEVEEKIEELLAR